ncbi:MAG: response regulator transcription factor [Sporichthya sp.]|nr:response regulator transcription factor [Sporichthya sp.]
MLDAETIVLVVLDSPTPRGLIEVLERAGAEVQAVTGLPAAHHAIAAAGVRAGALVCAEDQLVPLELAAAVARQAASVIVSAAANAQHRTDLVRGGADCVLGRLRPDEAVSLLAALLRRGSRTPDTVHDVEVGPLRLELAARTATLRGTPLSLTALEFDLLAFFMTHPGQVLSRERLRADVWGYNIGGLDTVTVHVRRLRVKIESDPSNPVLIRTVWGVGYRLDYGVEPVWPAT